MNAGNTLGAQGASRTIGLSDGTFATVWVDDTNNVDNDAGADIIGQVYDADGKPLRGPFQVDFAGGMHAFQPAVAALPDGRFVIVHLARSLDLSSPSGVASIFFTSFDSAGFVRGSGVIESGILNTDEAARPSVSAFADGTFVVSYDQRAGAGNPDVFAKLVTRSGSVGSPLNAGQNSPDADIRSDTTVLSNGRFLTVYEEADGAVTSIQYKLFTNAGVQVADNTLAASGARPRGAALGGGGFVIVWESGTGNGDISAAVLNGANQLTKPNFILQGGASIQNEPDVVALKDGGFFVVWDDAGLDQIRGQRFNGSGNAVGVSFKVGTAGSDPSLGLTDDGRILVTFTTTGLDVAQVILDPREKTIIGDNTNETITSRLDGATLNGAGGSDILLGQGGADRLIGGAGRDWMKGRGGNDVYFVDNSSDITDETGGSGVDSVISSASYDLRGSSTGIENLTLTGTAALEGGGSKFKNVISGNSGNNKLYGNAGNDVLRGNGGSDSLFGEHNIDTLTGGAQNDFFVFWAPLNSAHRDVITDFSNVAGNNDTIKLENYYMTNVGPVGALKASAFHVGAGAHDADDRIIYNKANGALYYDSNGTGAGGVFQLATLTNKPTLTAVDFVVI